MPELGEFFHDLRALRASAGLSLAELAERAHFPQEALAAAESGPGVPPNPLLVAYVQACGGPVGEWEDRWRAACDAAAGGLSVGAPEPVGVPEPAGAPRHAPPRRHTARRVVVAAAAVAVALAAAGTAVALTRSPAHPAASARPRTSPEASGHGMSGQGASWQDASPSAVSRPPSVSRRPAASPSASPSAPASAPPMTSIARIAGVGCPASQGDGVTLAAARPGPPWTAAQGGWAGNGCDGSSVWTMDPAGKPRPSTLTWSFGALPGASTCTLSVYVPTQNALGAAGYTVTTGTGVTLSTLTVDQAANAGYWVTLGTFAASGSGYQVQLVPETVELTAVGLVADGPGDSDSKPAPPGRNSAVAASAAAVTCSG